METRQRKRVLKSCVSHTLTQAAFLHPHIQTHMPWEKRPLFDAEKIFTAVWEMLWLGTSGAQCPEMLSRPWRQECPPARRRGPYVRWVLFRSQCRPCWEYWTRCSMLLCRVTGPMSRSRSLKNSRGQRGSLEGHALGPRYKSSLLCPITWHELNLTN